MDFESLKTYILDRLKSELNEDLMYHSPGHTKDVIKAVERYAELEGVNGHDKMLLKTAALFHDIGFTRVYKGHEDESIKIARDVLPGYGYSEKDIQAITGMINATKLPQNPTNHLEEIEAADKRRMIRLALDHLPPEDRVLVHAYYFEEMSIREICMITGMSESNVKIKLYRSRKVMHEVLQKTWVDEQAR